MKTSNDLESALQRLRELSGARERRTSGEVIDLDEERRKRQARTRDRSRLPQLSDVRESTPERKE